MRLLKYNKKVVVRNMGFGLSLLVSLILLNGCVANYGSLRPDGEVTRLFKTYQVQTEYQYYFSGPQSRPHAIMGIHRSYTLNSKLWKAVDISEEQLKSWVSSRMYGRLGISPKGYYIVDPDGKRIGIWYSMWDTTTVKIVGPGQVSVATPDLYSGPNALGNER